MHEQHPARASRHADVERDRGNVAKGFGCVGVFERSRRSRGRACHRRRMLAVTCRPDLLTSKVEDVMTKNPKSATPDQLALEVLETLNA